MPHLWKTLNAPRFRAMQPNFLLFCFFAVLASCVECFTRAQLMRTLFLVFIYLFILPRLVLPNSVVRGASVLDIFSETHTRTHTRAHSTYSTFGGETDMLSCQQNILVQHRAKLKTPPLRPSSSSSSASSSSSNI